MSSHPPTHTTPFYLPPCIRTYYSQYVVIQYCTCWRRACRKGVRLLACLLECAITTPRFFSNAFMQSQKTYEYFSEGGTCARCTQIKGFIARVFRNAVNSINRAVLRGPHLRSPLLAAWLPRRCNQLPVS